MALRIYQPPAPDRWCEISRLSADVELAGVGQRRCYRWVPCLPFAAVDQAVVIVHGLGDHGGRYDAVASEIAREGVGVQACDLQGHGRSPGRRGCIESYSALLAEVAASVAAAGTLWPNARLTLLGHSMGGNLAAMHVLRRPQADVQRLVLVAPMLRPAGRPMREDWLQAGCSLARYLPHLTWRRSVAQAERDTSLATDRLMHRRLSLQLGLSLIMSGRELLRDASRIAVETRIICGRDDAAIDLSSIWEFVERLPQGELRWVEGVGHEPLRQAKRDELEDLIDWLNLAAEEPPARRAA